MPIPSIPRISGIYLIVCLANGKYYVGSSQHIYRRWGDHRTRLKHGRHDNRHLQNAWNCYGSDSFSVLIIEYAESDGLLEREQFWIKWLNSCDDSLGFNLNAVSSMPPSRKNCECSIEHRAKISIANKGRKLDGQWLERIKHSNQQRQAKWFVVTSPDGCMSLIQNLNQFCIEHELQRSNMARTAAGITLQHKGWRCRYATEHDLIQPPLL